MKKPLIVWLAQIGLVLIIISYGFLTAGSLVGLVRGTYSATQSVVGLLVGAIASLSALVLLIKANRQMISSRSIILFFWAILIIYPVTNGLISLGLFPPRPYIPDDQLVGAAFVELFRYLGLLFLIVWLSFSKSAKAYLPVK